MATPLTATGSIQPLSCSLQPQPLSVVCGQQDKPIDVVDLENQFSKIKESVSKIELHVRRDFFTNPGLHWLAKIKDLQELSLNVHGKSKGVRAVNAERVVTGQSYFYRILATCSLLRTVCVNTDVAISIEAMQILSQLPLTHLSVRCEYLIREKTFGEIVWDLGGLTSWNKDLRHIEFCTQDGSIFPDAVLKSISDRCSNLQHLSISASNFIPQLKITPPTSQGVMSLAKLSKLEHLQLDFCQEVEDDAVAFLAKLDTLRYLHLGNCMKLTPKVLSFFPEKTSLQTLSIAGIKEVDKDMHKEFFVERSSLRLVSFGMHIFGRANPTQKEEKKAS